MAWDNRRKTLQRLLTANQALLTGGLGWMLWSAQEVNWPVATVFIVLVVANWLLLVLYFTQVTSHERLQALLSAGGDVVQGIAALAQGATPRFPGFGPRGGPSP
jgi:hypothetical protein